MIEKVVKFGIARTVVLAALLIVTACADSARVQTDARYQSVGLDFSANAYVAVPRDGSYGSTNYPGSGAQVAQVIRSALLFHLTRVTEGGSWEDLDQALASAAAGGYRYLFFPTILHWEDRATEWNMKPDRVTVKIDVMEVASKKRLTSATINGKSGVVTMGGDHPQDLLPEPVANFIRQLF